MKNNISITENNVGKRIDKFLQKEVFLNIDITRGEIIRKIKNGEILLNNEITKPSHILQAGDKINVKLKKKSEKLIPNKKIKINIIYQDKNIIVVNKPAGISVHPNDTEKENTLVNALIVAYPEIKDIHDSSTSSEQAESKDNWMRPGIVHRLDKDTSGAMVIARNKKTFDALKKKFQNREIEKNYVAVVHGHLKKKSGTVDEPIARSASFKKQKIAYGKMKGTARPAVTEYKLLKRYADFDFIEAIPKTGRMHQIRVHLAHLGNPIVGDDKYTRKNLTKPTGITRQLLHAQKIKFELDSKQYEFKAEVPEDFAAFLKSLNKTDPIHA